MSEESCEDDISGLLKSWNIITKERKEIVDKEEAIKNKIKIHLKERKWDRYLDKDTKISVSIITEKRENIDKAHLKLMIGESQYAQIVTTTTFEKMLIFTPERRKQLNSFIGGGQNRKKAKNTAEIAEVPK